MLSILSNDTSKSAKKYVEKSTQNMHHLHLSIFFLVYTHLRIWDTMFSHENILNIRSFQSEAPSDHYIALSGMFRNAQQQIFLASWLVL